MSKKKRTNREYIKEEVSKKASTNTFLHILNENMNGKQGFEDAVKELGRS